MNNIGDRIKQKRKELGFTQAELGEKLNITDRAISKWEQGEGDPNLSIIPDIAKWIITVRKAHIYKIKYSYIIPLVLHFFSETAQ